ncbi:MAG: SDR family oxidoreductase [Rhodobacteraceae bacterium]|nr:SDR family oxidoreductase [Paracoccaceae bacterium]
MADGQLLQPKTALSGAERLDALRLIRSRRVGAVTWHRLMAEHGSAKAALNAMSLSLAHEYAPKVRVNTICPGQVWTPMAGSHMSPARRAERVKADGFVTEAAVQKRIMDHFAEHRMTTYSPPIVGEGPHSGDPHFEPKAEIDRRIGPNSYVLIDLWAKLDRPMAVYSDLTHVGYVGDDVPEPYDGNCRYRHKRMPCWLHFSIAAVVVMTMMHSWP